jgi:hypothetical protein
VLVSVPDFVRTQPTWIAALTSGAGVTTGIELLNGIETSYPKGPLNLCRDFSLQDNVYLYLKLRGIATHYVKSMLISLSKSNE